MAVGSLRKRVLHGSTGLFVHGTNLICSEAVVVQIARMFNGRTVFALHGRRRKE